MNESPYCCEAARTEAAPLAGTASRAEVWLLVEHTGAWGAHAVEENDLPAVVQEWLAAQLAALGRARALLVRRETAAAAGGTTAFLAVAREDRQELYRFAVESPAALAGLDLAGLLAAGGLAPFRSEERLTLVCTNGRRDRCCARHGVPVWRELARVEGRGVWQSTHQGGHRYAASVLWLPEGVCYGFVDPGDAGALAAARAAGALYPPRFRGRAFHPPPAQAADALLREVLGIDALDAWRVVEAAEQGGGRWRVRLAAPGRSWGVVVERRQPTALVSCTPAKAKPIDEYHLVDWREESPP